jgi:hypothetical protein
MNVHSAIIDECNTNSCTRIMYIITPICMGASRSLSAADWRVSSTINPKGEDREHAPGLFVFEQEYPWGSPVYVKIAPSLEQLFEQDN